MIPNFTTNDALQYIYQEASSQLTAQIHIARNRDDSFNEALLEFELLRLTPNNLSIEKILAYSRKQKFESA